MELRGNFLPQFEVLENQLVLPPSTTKRDYRPVVGMFSRPVNPSRRHFLLSTTDGRILKSIATMTKVSVTWIFPRRRVQSLPSSLLTGYSLPIKNVLDCKDETLVVLSLARLYLMKSFGTSDFLSPCLTSKWQTAAWLRAEAHWESLSYMRHADSHKRKYAEEEFYALKRRCFGQEGNSLNCFCFVAAKKEDKNVRRTVLNSIVGTLDLSIRQFMQGEKHPGEIKRLSAVFASQEPFGAHKYAYIANVCVAKYARRQGIASNMLYLATEIAMNAGMKQLFVHVNADNKPAQDLYNKTGFKVIEAASSKDQRILMSIEL